MDHKSFKQKLFDLYDGALTSADRQDVEIHLAQCAECRETYATWKKTAQALFRVPAPAVSEAFVHQVLDRLPAAPLRRQRVLWIVRLEWLVPAVGLAALMLTVLKPVEAVSVDAMLFGDEQEQASSHVVLAGGSASSDEVLRLVWEGSR